MARYSRRGGRHRRAAGRGERVRGYSLRDGKGRPTYFGVTNDPGRRATEHKRDGKRGKLNVETRPMSRGYARSWEKRKLARHRKMHHGRNPVHNRTRSGGWNQLVRARGSHPRGPGFESLRAHQCVRTAFSPCRSRPREARLLSGLDDDATTGHDFDVQVVAVQHGHAYERGGIRFIRINKSRLPTPEHRHPVGVKYVPATVGQDQTFPSQPC